MENTCKHAPVGVIILNWNGRQLLERFLPSVIENSNPLVSDIIVADNGSEDSSVEFVKQNFPSVDVWTFEKNYGFAEGYNRAVAMAADYEFVVLLNSDVAVAKGWDEVLFDFMKKKENENVAAAQPKILSYNNPTMFEYAGAAGGFIDKHGYPYCRGRIFNVCENDYGQYDSPMDVFWATGACVMVRRKDYLDAGGLDTDFFAHMEEIDLCWRFHLVGKRVAVVPQASVYHLGGGSLPAENPQKTYLNFRNNLLMLHKNLPESRRRSVLFRRRLLDSLAWAKYMATFDFANANAILKAHRDFKTMRKNYRTSVDADYLAEAPGGKHNILIKFYLQKKRAWSEL